LSFHFKPGLPDGTFSNPKYQFGNILEDISMEGDGIFYGHLIYFVAIWYILRPFGVFRGIWDIFIVLVCCTKKNLATLFQNTEFCAQKRIGVQENCHFSAFENYKFLAIFSKKNVH
jgi:hypothetical protein